MINIDFKDIEIMPQAGGGGGDGGNGNPFEVIGYTEIPQSLYCSIDYSKTIQDNWDASVTNRSKTFSGDTKLVYFPIVDTSNVTDMSYMFYGCSNLQYVPEIDTSNVTNMSYMFQNCYGLTSLDLSSFDTSKVTNMTYMFSNCSGLTSSDLSSFDTSNVTSMNYMFNGCSGLTSLDVSSFNTSNVTFMNYMFNGCSGLTSLDLSSFDTSKVTNMNAMFSICTGLTELDLTSFDTSNVTNMGAMFSKCSGLTRVDGILSVKSLSASTMSNDYFTGYLQTRTLRKITFKDIGYHSNAKQFNTTYIRNWGVDDDTITDARQSLIHSLITYSFDRATAGYSACTISLNSSTKAVLTEDEIAAITAKGFTLA